MAKVNVLSVCGSGTVTSSMLSAKIREHLAQHGYDVSAVETNPGGVETALGSGKFDFIAYTCPIKDVYEVPIVSAMGFLTGFGEEEFIEEVLKVLKSKE